MPALNTRWVLFDAVGTLLYPDPPAAEVYCDIGKRWGSRLSVTEIGQRFRLALDAEQQLGQPTSEAIELDRWRRIVSRVLSDVTSAEQAFEQLWHHFAQPEHWRLYEDVAPALDSLTRRGFQLGIASNFDTRLHQIVCGHQPLAACQAVFVSSEVGFTKPHAGFFASIEQTLNVSPADITLIGDDELADIAGATAAGWQAIHLRRSRKADSPFISVLAEL